MYEMKKPKVNRFAGYDDSNDGLPVIYDGEYGIIRGRAKFSYIMNDPVSDSPSRVLSLLHTEKFGDRTVIETRVPSDDRANSGLVTKDTV